MSHKENLLVPVKLDLEKQIDQQFIHSYLGCFSRHHKYLKQNEDEDRDFTVFLELIGSLFEYEKELAENAYDMHMLNGWSLLTYNQMGISIQLEFNPVFEECEVINVLRGWLGVVFVPFHKIGAMYPGYGSNFMTNSDKMIESIKKS